MPVPRFVLPVGAACLVAAPVALAVGNGTHKGAVTTDKSQDVRLTVKNNRVTIVHGATVEDDKRTITGTFRGAKGSGAIKVEGLCSSDRKDTAKR